MDPVVAEVDPHRGQQPGEGRVPGERHQAVVGVHIHIGRAHTAGHQRSGESCVIIVLYGV